MPRTRIDIDRDSKVAEIVTAAEAALLAGKYEALSHTAVARTVGLARAAVCLIAGQRVRALAWLFYVDSRLRIAEEAAVAARAGGEDLAQRVVVPRAVGHVAAREVGRRRAEPEQFQGAALRWMTFGREADQGGVQLKAPVTIARSLA